LLNSNKIINDYSFRARNAFFVSVTRSRGWCFITAHDAEESKSLEGELSAIINDYPKFKFEFPDLKEYNEAIKIISTSDKKIDLYEKEIEDRVKDEAYKAILLEMIKKDPKLAEEIKKRLE